MNQTHFSLPGQTGLTEYLLALPPARRGALVQSVASFRPLPTIDAEFELGPIRAAFSRFWEETENTPIPIQELQKTLNPPVPVKTVLEFSKLMFARNQQEMNSGLRQLVDHLKSQFNELQSTCQLRLFEPKSKVHHEDNTSVLVNTVSSLNELISKSCKYPTIYADPPWPYENQASRAATGNHYPTMQIEEICAEPVSELACKNAHLHLWTTNGFLREAFEVIDAWGFRFKSCLVWIKDQIGMGNYWRVSHEFLLLGVRGSLRFRNHATPSWIQAPRTIHSRKPAQFRTLIEKVSPGPYLEMYGREALPNSAWTVYGNQVDTRWF